jgi:hypothetical protein
LSLASLYQLAKDELTTLETYIEKEVSQGGYGRAGPRMVHLLLTQGGRLRLVVDYRQLNTVTVENAYHGGVDRGYAGMGVLTEWLMINH